MGVNSAKRGSELDVGSKSHYVKYSKDGKSFSIANPKGRAEGKVSEYNLVKFHAMAGDDACPEVWSSTHRNPWALCTHPTKAGHTTKRGGAHAVGAGFPKKATMCLLVSAVRVGLGATVAALALPATCNVSDPARVGSRKFLSLEF